MLQTSTKILLTKIIRHATPTRTPKPGYLNLSIIYTLKRSKNHYRDVGSNIFQVTKEIHLLDNVANFKRRDPI
jgi:hypothetical protein